MSGMSASGVGLRVVIATRETGSVIKSRIGGASSSTAGRSLGFCATVMIGAGVTSPKGMVVPVIAEPVIAEPVIA